MIRLTVKQETFCVLVAAGLTGSASACYRAAYPGGKASKKTVNEASSRLMTNSKVITRIKELRAPVIEETRYDLRWCLGRQNDAVTLAEETGNAGAMTGGVREIGKLGGIYPSEKQELTLKGDDLVVRLQQGRARLAEEDT
jgi:hypothetical protein